MAENSKTASSSAKSATEAATEAAVKPMSRWLYAYWGVVGVTAVMWGINWWTGSALDPVKIDSMKKVLKSKGLIPDKPKATAPADAAEGKGGEGVVGGSEAEKSPDSGSAASAAPDKDSSKKEEKAEEVQRSKWD
eukprot:Nk52_evm73s158 gene=Nk52_evmTU73s158